jgi:hypothetical protein
LALDVFLGYSPGPKGYHCLDLTSNKVIISRHVKFDKSSFPLIESNSTPSFVGTPPGHDWSIIYWSTLSELVQRGVIHYILIHSFRISAMRCGWLNHVSHLRQWDSAMVELNSSISVAPHLHHLIVLLDARARLGGRAMRARNKCGRAISLRWQATFWNKLNNPCLVYSKAMEQEFQKGPLVIKSRHSKVTVNCNLDVLNS